MFTSKIKAFVFALPLIVLCGCSKENDEQTLNANFRTQVDVFCDEIYTIDISINELDTGSESYKETLLSYLSELKDDYYSFSQIEFPSDYEYLESVADEAYDYMNTAYIAYEDLFSENYDKELLQEKYDYATENYSRAYKRIQVIITFLNGEAAEEQYLQQ